jgi:hypothetical protein
LDRTAADGSVSEGLDPEDLTSESGMGGSLRLDVYASQVEVVDAGLCIRDRGIGTGPCETDFEFRKRNTVDDDRLEIRPPDPGVPEAPASLESLDLKALIIHVAPPGNSDIQGKHESIRACVNWFTSRAWFLPILAREWRSVSRRARRLRMPYAVEKQLPPHYHPQED